MQLRYWCFTEQMAEDAAKEFAAEIGAGEGEANPGSAHIYERIIRDFLNSEVSRKRGLLKLQGGDDA